MLALIVIVTVLGALLVEWMIHHIRENYEVEWPGAAGDAALPPAAGPFPGSKFKPMRLQKAERQMNGAFNDASDDIWLK